MESYLPLLLDGLTILLFLYFVVKSARHGFLRSVVQFAGYLAAAFFSAVMSFAVAQGVYQGILRGMLLRTIEDSVANLSNPQAVTEQLNEILSSLPKILVNALHFDTGNAGGQLSTYISDSASSIALSVVDNLIGPAVMLLIQGVVFILLFVVSLFVVRIVAKAFTGFNHVPLIGPINTLLGGCVGGLEAILFFTLFGVVVTVINAATNSAIPWLTPDVVDATFFLRLFFEKNLILAMLGA